MKFQNREALQLETKALRVTVLRGGGHIAEILHKKTGVNPLWIPPWSSIEPSQYDATVHPQYGLNVDAKLLAGIMGHSLCLDIFGPPSDEELSHGISARRSLRCYLRWRRWGRATLSQLGSTPFGAASHARHTHR